MTYNEFEERTEQINREIEHLEQKNKHPIRTLILDHWFFIISGILIGYYVGEKLWH